MPEYQILISIASQIPVVVAFAYLVLKLEERGSLLIKNIFDELAKIEERHIEALHDSEERQTQRQQEREQNYQQMLNLLIDVLKNGNH